MPVEELSYTLLSDKQQYLRCSEPSLWTKGIQKPKAISGYFTRDAEEMIQKLRKEGFPGDYKDIREEAIRRVRRIYE